MVSEAEDRQGRPSLQLPQGARAFTVSQEREDAVVDSWEQRFQLGSDDIERVAGLDRDVLDDDGVLREGN